MYIYIKWVNLQVKKTKAWVPYVSLLGALYFLIYIKNVPSEVPYSVKLFDDDTYPTSY